MSVQIPDGRKGTIHVFPGDDPRDLATNFCTKYELKDPKLQRLVERHITDSMKNLPQASAHPLARSSHRSPYAVCCMPRSPATDAAAELFEEVEGFRGRAAAAGQRSGCECSARELGGGGRDSAAAPSRPFRASAQLASPLEPPCATEGAAATPGAAAPRG